MGNKANSTEGTRGVSNGVVPELHSSSGEGARGVNLGATELHASGEGTRVGVGVALLLGILVAGCATTTSNTPNPGSYRMTDERICLRGETSFNSRYEVEIRNCEEWANICHVELYGGYAMGWKPILRFVGKRCEDIKPPFETGVWKKFDYLGDTNKTEPDKLTER